MKIQDFVGTQLKYDVSAIAIDLELSQELQMLLIELGLLTAPLEEPFGARAMAALTRFQHQNGCVEPEFLGPQTVEKLIEASSLSSRGLASPGITLEGLQTTVLKLRPLDSSVLKSSEKITFPAGKKLELTFFAIERQHTKIVSSQPIQNSAVWYVFSNHVKILGGEELDKSQRDNRNNLDGACNVIVDYLRFGT